MTFAAACVWSLVRSLAVALIGTVISLRLQRRLQSGTGWRARAMWSLLLLPVVVPSLLIGYGYRNFSLSLVHHPVWNELVYGVLMLFLVAPVGTLILACSPPPLVSATGLHAGRLMGRRWSLGRRLSLWARSRAFAVLPAVAVMFLLTFQETEVAALMQARGWPEWMFTRLSIDLSPAGALLRLLVPIVLQLLVIGSAVWVIRGARLARPATSTHSPLLTAYPVFVDGYLLLATLGVLIVPGSLVLRGTLEGFAVLAAHPGLMSQIGIGLLFGLTSGVLAWILSGWIVERIDQSWGWPLAIVLLLPGLLGAWTLGLSLAELFRLRLLRPVYETPLPMIVGEVLFQLPRAVLVRLLLGRWRDSSAAHSARLLTSAGDTLRRQRAADILWHLDTRGRLLGGMIVCYWAYMEVTISSPSLLGPPGMTTAPVLLYNLMHYGQIPGLSALVLAAIAVPVVCLFVVSQVARRFR